MIFKNSTLLYEKQSSYQLKILHTNGRGEYIGEYNNYLQENGITHEITTPYSTKQNEKAKKVNCIIMGLIQVIFTQQKLPKLLWAEIIKAIVYL